MADDLQVKKEQAGNVNKGKRQKSDIDAAADDDDSATTSKSTSTKKRKKSDSGDDASESKSTSVKKGKKSDSSNDGCDGNDDQPTTYPPTELINIKMMQYPLITKNYPAFAIILNNKTFDTMKEREGTDKDKSTICSLKEKFNGMIAFHECILTDLKADEIKGAFKMLAQHDPESIEKNEIDGAVKLVGGDKELASSPEEKRKYLKDKKIDFSKYSCFMAFIMSHGGKTGISGKDDDVYGTKTVKVDTLSSYFTPNQCEGLKDKPKMFFVQACRGSKRDVLPAVDCGSSNVPTDDIPPKTADFLFVYATSETYVAIRDAAKGSLFIQTLVEVMEQTAGSYHLEEILLFVKNEIGRKTTTILKKNENGTEDVKQMVSVVSQLRGRVHFAEV